MLILPPPNHSACGGSHLSTVSHFLNQSSSSAMRAQKTSGLSCASARRLSTSASDLMCARAENSRGGGNTRSSCRTDSMFVVTVDTAPSLQLLISGFGLALRACVPQNCSTPQQEHLGNEALRRHERLQLQRVERQLLSGKHSGG